MVAVTDDVRSRLVHYALTGSQCDVTAGVRRTVADRARSPRPFRRNVWWRVAGRAGPAAGH